VADDSDEDDAFSGTKRRKKAAAAEGTEDELDRLEAKIEQDARRDSTGAGDSDNKEGDMDVESEEESDEDQVRRVKGPGRRKAPVFDEDEDD